MKKIKYTPDAADKLRELKKAISQEYGSDNAKKIVKTITDEIRGLCDYEEKGPEVSKMFGVVTDYRYLVVSKNYVFYRIEDKYIRIINLYHEKEDFMWQLFGIDTTPQETIDYWDE
ncbi:MAG: type II toxin-antitoxin system RelE/ParE family toxin [Lachnospiraceae bacterium]|nr:type II toxin-antitoxin system RelE/ParE family toxin [Lachnospiraceae bacterium]